MLSGSYDCPNKIKLLTPASLFTCLTIAFQRVRGGRIFPSCARLDKGMELHWRRPRQPATYWQAPPGTLISKVTCICVFPLTTCLNVLNNILRKIIRDQSPHSSCVDTALTFTVQKTKHRPAHYWAPTKHYIAHAQVMITGLTTFHPKSERTARVSPWEHRLCYRSSTAHGHAHRALHRSSVQKKCQQGRHGQQGLMCSENSSPMLAERIQCLAAALPPPQASPTCRHCSGQSSSTTYLRFCRSLRM